MIIKHCMKSKTVLKAVLKSLQHLMPPYSITVYGLRYIEENHVWIDYWFGRQIFEFWPVNWPIWGWSVNTEIKYRKSKAIEEVNQDVSVTVPAVENVLNAFQFYFQIQIGFFL